MDACTWISLSHTHTHGNTSEFVMLDCTSGLEMENPKLHLWAKLIQNGHWEGYDAPPPTPLITGEKKPRKENVADALTGAANAIVSVLQPQQANSPKKVVSNSDQQLKISPMKSATIRRSCLEDLKRLKNLHEDGVLTEAEFKEEKGQILATLRSLK